MEYAFFWAMFAVAVGVIASHRGRSGFAWFVLSLLVSPLIGVILVALLPSLHDAPKPSTHVKCPDCAELVLSEARVCKHCGCRLVPVAEQSASSAQGGSAASSG